MYIFDNKHNKMFLLAIHRWVEQKSGSQVWYCPNYTSTLTFIGHIPNTSTRVG